MEKLIQNRHFQRFHGHRHIIVSRSQQAFDYVNVRNVQSDGLTHELYQKLANVTIACEMDAFATANYTSHKIQSDYSRLVSIKQPVTQHSFSYGLGAGPDIPFRNATYEKWQNSTN